MHRVKPKYAAISVSISIAVPLTVPMAIATDPEELKRFVGRKIDAIMEDQDSFAETLYPEAEKIYFWKIAGEEK